MTSRQGWGDGWVLVVDAANVVGSRPDGWWRDRAGAAARLHQELMVADTGDADVVLVLEGGARAGVRAGTDHHVRTVHAKRDGDATIVEVARRAAEQGAQVRVVTADRALAARVEHLGALVQGPRWLLDRLGQR